MRLGRKREARDERVLSFLVKWFLKPQGHWNKERKNRGEKKILEVLPSHILNTNPSITFESFTIPKPFNPWQWITVYFAFKPKLAFRLDPQITIQSFYFRGSSCDGNIYNTSITRVKHVQAKRSWLLVFFLCRINKTGLSECGSGIEK